MYVYYPPPSPPHPALTASSSHHRINSSSHHRMSSSSHVPITSASHHIALRVLPLISLRVLPPVVVRGVSRRCTTLGSAGPALLGIQAASGVQLCSQPVFSHVVPVIGQPLGTNPIRGMRYGFCSASPCPCPTPEGGMGFRDVSRLGVLPGSGRSHIWRDRAADNCCPECA